MRIVEIDGEPRDFADVDAVEHHGRADLKAADGIHETDAIAEAIGNAAGVLQPIDEAEAQADDHQHEEPDQPIA